jgi:hypothetical protein
MPDPMFTGLSAMLQNSPFVKQQRCFRVARGSLGIHTGERTSVYDVVGPNRRGTGTY